MYKEHYMAQKLVNLPWGRFVEMIKYKAERYGKQVIFVNRYYPSSQLCSACGYKNPDLKDLKIREWICPVCGAKHQRDENSAINILNEGLRTFYEEE